MRWNDLHRPLLKRACIVGKGGGVAAEGVLRIALEVNPEVSRVAVDAASLANRRAILSVAFRGIWLVLAPVFVAEWRAAGPFERALVAQIVQADPRTLPVVPRCRRKASALAQIRIQLGIADGREVGAVLLTGALRLGPVLCERKARPVAEGGRARPLGGGNRQRHA